MHLKERKIMVVDDSPFHLKLYKRYLSNYGFKIILNCATAHELLLNLAENPELIFLDYHLADGIGLDLLDKIKAYNPAIDVVIISGQPDMEVTVRVLSSGAFGYIIKDEFEPERISEIIERWLATRALEDDIPGEILLADSHLKQVLVNAQSNVRKEISGELHDNVNQLLGAAKLYLETACKNNENKMFLIKESKAIIETAIKEIRKLSHRLHLEASNEINLEQDVLKIVADLQNQNLFNVKADIRLGAHSIDVVADVQKQVLRIIQELTNNAAKYSRASKVDIGIQLHSDSLFLRIADNGIGFNLEEVRRGLGFISISDRISKINGSYTIFSSPGKGCKWEIAVPVQLN